MFPLASGVAMGQGGPALSISLNKANLDPIALIGGQANHPLDTSAGDIDITATAAGGDESYTFAWTLNEVGDDTNVFSVLAAGTQNAAQYNTLTIRADARSAPGPNNVDYEITCTVTDGTSATAEVTINQPLVSVAL